MIRIISKRHNFRRAGIPHPKGPAEYPDDRFSDEELRILKAEPMLTVEELDDAPDKTVGGTPPEKMTVSQLKELLDTLEVEYPSDARKDELIALAKAEPPEVA